MFLKGFGRCLRHAKINKIAYDLFHHYRIHLRSCPALFTNLVMFTKKTLKKMINKTKRKKNNNN